MYFPDGKSPFEQIDAHIHLLYDRTAQAYQHSFPDEHDEMTNVFWKYFDRYFECQTIRENLDKSRKIVWA